MGQWPVCRLHLPDLQEGETQETLKEFSAFHHWRAIMIAASALDRTVSLELLIPQPVGQSTRPPIRVWRQADFEAMADMFMIQPPTFDEMMVSIAALESKLNS